MIPSTLRILFWNVNGSLNFKLTNRSFVDTLLGNDIIVLVESMLRQTDFLDLEYLGYWTIRNDRKTASGGVVIAVKSILKPFVQVFSNVPGSEQIYITVFERFILGAVYIPPQGSPYYDQLDRFAHISEAIAEIERYDKPFVIVGDFNARFGCRSQKLVDISNDSIETYRITNADKIVNSSGRKLLALCEECSAVILTDKTWPGDYTCYKPNGRSTIDTGIASPHFLDNLSRGRVFSLDQWSDHVPISFCIDCPVPTSTLLTSTTTTRKVVVSRHVLHKTLNDPEKLSLFQQKLSKSDTIEGFCQELDGLFSSGTCVSKQKLSDLMSKFYRNFNDFVKSTLSCSKKRVGNSKKSNNIKGTIEVFYDQQCLSAKRSFYQVQRRFRKNASDENYAILKRRLRIMKSHQRRCRRASESKHLAKLFEPTNVSQLWSLVKPKSVRQYTGPLSNQEFTLHLESIANGKFPFDKEKSEKAFRFLNGVASFSVLPKDLEDSLLQNFPLSEFFALKNNKACGSDGWAGELIKCLRPALERVIPKLFIICLKSGCTPDQWDSDIKVPVPKPNKSPNLLSSLRPITLVNTLMKQYEKWLLSLLEKYYTTYEEQAGFKKDYSCVSRLFVLRSILNKYVHVHKKKVYSVFIDFSSFFDTVHEEFLCEYLASKGVPWFVINPLHNMLSGVKATVFMKNEFGRSFSCKVGLRQGSCISPKLATAFLDQVTDLLRRFEADTSFDTVTTNHIFYADDLVMFFTDPNKLQSALDLFSSLVTKLGLNVSVEKSFSVVFSNTSTKGIKSFTWQNSPLPQHSEAVYLGCAIDSKVRFTAQICRNTKKANRAFAILLNFQKRFPSLSFERFLQLYKTLVSPCLCYASEMYAWDLGDKLNDVFVEHLRRYLSLPKSVSKNAIHWLTNTYPIHATLWIQAYRFWKKCSALNQHRFERSAMKMSFDLELPWVKSMLGVFGKIGFEGNFCLWTHSDIKSNETRFETLVYSYFEIQLETWKSSSSYRFLIGMFPVRHSIWFMQYANFSDRRILSKLFLRVYNFETITGVWHRIPLSERFCQHCIFTAHGPVLGDERHYLIECPKFEIARSSMGITSDQLLDALKDPSCIPVSIQATARFLSRFVVQSFARLNDPFSEFLV